MQTTYLGDPVLGAPQIIVENDKTRFVLGPNCFVVFIDETGHESLRDPQYPVFGLGGCAALVGNYVAAIDTPWRTMKENFFGGAETRLHASDLPRPTSNEQLGALATFFEQGAFCRLAATINTATDNETNLAKFQLTGECLMKCVEDVAQHWRISAMALLFEDSERGNRLAKRYLGAYDRIERDDGPPMPLMQGFLPKSALAGLEVADFVMHAAGGAAKFHAEKGKWGKRRRDFHAVFQPAERRLTSFQHITAARG